MSLLQFPPTPRETAQAAEAAFGKGNLYLTIGDRINRFCLGVDWADLYGSAKPVSAISMLAFVTLFQFVEDLADYQAAEALRVRVDWKYALHLPLDNPGFDGSALCDFRRRLFHHPAAMQAFQGILTRLLDFDLLCYPGKQPASARDVLMTVCGLSRLEALSRGMQVTIETLAAHDPKWLSTIARPYWYERYRDTSSTWRRPANRQEREATACAIAADAWYLLHMIAAAHKPPIALLPEVLTLREMVEEPLEPRENQVKSPSWGCPQCISAF
ncbi:MAG: transposase [Chloroflexi bacterium]|nr:transposase [Chloroflexota bacterium]